MKLWRNFLVCLAGFVLIGMIIPSVVRADCEVASFDQNTRNLEVCVGGFNSKSELRSTILEFVCVDNSNLMNDGQCMGITGPTDYSFSSVPNSLIAEDSSGKYYTCPIIQGVNRAIGVLQIDCVKDGNVFCSMTEQTAPDDWDWNSEGLPWDEGTNNPVKSSNFLCPDGESINTAFGCIPVKIDKLVGWLLPYLFGIAGGISFLLMVYSFILMATSGGDPKKFQGAKETLTSAITGLLVSIFALFILKLVAVDILQIPGF